MAIATATHIYLLTNFPTGNHDWSRMAGLEFYSYQVKLGRWLAPAVYALTGYRQLPMLNALLGLAGYVSAGIATCLLVECTTSKRVPTAGFLVAALLCATIPWGSWTFYYSWMAAMGPIAQLLCVGALVCAAQRPTLGRVLVGGIGICLSMASYQSSINTAATVFWLIAIVTISTSSNDGARGSARKLAAVATAIVLGAGLYKLSLVILRHLDLLATTYHFRFLGWDALPSRLTAIATASGEHLLMPHAFFPRSLKLSLLGLSLVGVSVLVVRAYQAPRTAGRPGAWWRGMANAVFVLIGTILMVLCTKIQFLVSENADYFEHRFTSFGLTYVYVPLIVVAITYLRRRVRAAYVMASGLCLWACMISDLSWQDASVKQDQYDKRTIDRIIGRIEGLRGFSYRKKYTLVQLGTIANIRDEYYDYPGRSHSAYLNSSGMPSWNPTLPYEGLEPKFDIQVHVSLEREDFDAPNPGLDKVVEHVRKSKPWPASTSVAIVGDYLVIVLNKASVPEIERRWSKGRARG